MLFEDDDVLAISKPPGMSVHGGAGEKGPTLIDLVRAAYPAGGDEVTLVHRLDRATSGLMILAKSTDAASTIGKSWEDAEKTYLAIALGFLKRDLVVDQPIEDRYGVSRSATTRAHPLAQLDAIEPATTLVSVTIGTGRTHQIRLHLAEKKHPVMGDEKHGDFPANKAWARAIKDEINRRGGTTRAVKHLMLHSFRLAFTHPATGERVTLEAPPPAGWADLLEAGGSGVDVLSRVP
ncbi:RluA family pseudouridine synthase [Myxococcota bacterium]|nr:RluA family pseudouridine synthase [Myxococcota bacterium]